MFNEDEAVRKSVLEKMPAFSDALFTNNPLLKKLFLLKTQSAKKSTIMDPTLIHVRWYLLKSYTTYNIANPKGEWNKLRANEHYSITKNQESRDRRLR